MSKLIDINTLFGVTNEHDLVRDEGAIINSYVNIISISKRSRKFRPNYGSSAYSFLGQPISVGTAMQLQSAIASDLQRFQPYATVGPSDVQVTINSNYTGYDLIVSYTSRLTSVKNTINFQLQAFLPSVYA